MPQQKIELQKVRDMGDLITDTFSYIRIHIRSYGLSILYFMVPLLLVSSIIVGSSYGNIIGAALSEDPQMAQSEAELISSSLGFFAGLILTLIAVGMLMVITYNHVRLLSQGKEDIKPGDLISNVFIKIVGLVALNFIYFILVFLASLFFIIPGIYVAIRLSLSTAIYIIEDIDIIEAMKRSWDLVEGHWWLTFGILIVMSIITNIISSVFTVPILIVSIFMGVAGAEGGSNLSFIIGILYSLSLTISTIFTAIPLLTNALHYYNLRERKEGGSLRDRIEQLRI